MKCAECGKEIKDPEFITKKGKAWHVGCANIDTSSL